MRRKRARSREEPQGRGVGRPRVDDGGRERALLPAAAEEAIQGLAGERTARPMRQAAVLQLQQRHGNGHVQRLLRGVESGNGAAEVQRKPARLITGFTFLGQTVGGGINAALKAKLTAVEAHLKQEYDRLAAAQPTAGAGPWGGGPLPPFEEWAGVKSVRGWRVENGTSFHTSGSAVDVNYELQPYIATRTTSGSRTTFGGEAQTRNAQAERRAATDVYDRAVQFMQGRTTNADVSMRQAGEKTAEVYKRFKATSDALIFYFGFAFKHDPKEVTRRPVRNIETIAEARLLAAIPESERKPLDEAVATLDLYLRVLKPGWPLTGREQYVRMLRDYEHVRIPMVKGAPSASPAETRNPARGFLDMRAELVEAMTDVGGLRWGAADFGPAESGDVHHFDLGHHGGVTPDGTP